MTREAVLHAVAAHPGATVYDLEGPTGLTLRQLGKLLCKMLKQDYLEVSGVAKMPHCTRRVYCYSLGSKGADVILRAAMEPKKPEPPKPRATRATIYPLLIDAHPYGLTIYEVAKALGADHVQTRYVMVEMAKDGKITPMGEKVMMPNCNRPVSRYVITAKQRKRITEPPKPKPVPPAKRVVDELQGFRQQFGHWAACAWNVDKAAQEVALLPEEVNA